MKKNFMTPDIRIVRFENKDIIVTSDKMEYDGTATKSAGTLDTQARVSIWD